MFCFHEFHFLSEAHTIRSALKGFFFQNIGIGMVLLPPDLNIFKPTHPKLYNFLCNSGVLNSLFEKLLP